mmetsp:Transcript_45659/g.126749  ORF Transcript_45659/g.126749 Transcript_45659/m.126749 type:complete len:222 (+) Transcript_45659:177-842(+)
MGGQQLRLPQFCRHRSRRPLLAGGPADRAGHLPARRAAAAQLGQGAGARPRRAQARRERCDAPPQAEQHLAPGHPAAGGGALPAVWRRRVDPPAARGGRRARQPRVHQRCLGGQGVARRAAAPRRRRRVVDAASQFREAPDTAARATAEEHAHVIRDAGGATTREINVNTGVACGRSCAHSDGTRAPRRVVAGAAWVRSWQLARCLLPRPGAPNCKQLVGG